MEECRRVDQYLSSGVLRTIDFPILDVVRRFRTDGYFMFPPRDPNNPGTQYLLTTANFMLITPMEETIIIVNGSRRSRLSRCCGEEMRSKP